MAGGIATIGTLLGKVNSANALVVTLSGGSAVATTFVGPAADNTGAVPFTFTSDSNTGLASAAADTVNLVTGGTSRLAVSTSAVTSTVPVLGVDGLAATPTFGWAAEAGLGIYRPSLGTISMAFVGNESIRFASGAITLLANNALFRMGTGADVILTRDAAAALQMGVDAAGVTNQMFKGPDRITSDGVGGNLTIAGGRNLGASAGGSLIFQTSPAAGAGVTGTLATALTISSTAQATFTGAVTVFRANASETTDGNVTYTAAQVLGGLITRSGIAANRVDAFPTAANLVAGINGCVVGTSFDLVVNNNDDASTITVNGASTGITYDGAATAIAAGEARLFRVLITNVTGAAEAATVFQVV